MKREDFNTARWHISEAAKGTDSILQAHEALLEENAELLKYKMTVDEALKDWPEHLRPHFLWHAFHRRESLQEPFETYGREKIAKEKRFYREQVERLEKLEALMKSS